MHAAVRGSRDCRTPLGLARSTSHARCNALQERLTLENCEADVVLLAIDLLPA
jgi:LSD1 subclass zinc finger protein